MSRRPCRVSHGSTWSIALDNGPMRPDRPPVATTVVSASSGAVLDCADRYPVLEGIDQFHVAERARHLADHARDSLIPFPTNANRPFHRCVSADDLLELWGGFRKIVGPDEGRPRAIGPMNDGDIGRGERCTRIDPGNGGIVPPGHLAKHDVGKQRPGKFQRFCDASQVVDGHHGSQDRRQMKNAGACGLELLVRHGLFGRAKKDSAAGQLTDGRS